MSNIWIFPVTALVPLIIGAIWYNPNIFGRMWLRTTGMTEEETRGGNVVLRYALVFLFGLFLTAIITPIVVHQNALISLIYNDLEYSEPGSDVHLYWQDFLDKYGERHRTFGHGAFHGAFAGLLFALPVLGTISVFERRGFKYVAVHTGYWILTIALMGGLLAQFSALPFPS